MKTLRLCVPALLLLSSGCSEDVGSTTGGPPPGDPTAFIVEVSATGRTFVRLATPEVVTLPDDGMSSTDWDIAFSGFDVFTNSGLSGSAEGGAFPIDRLDYEAGEIPDIPFLIEDESGGAFVDWYAYDPGEHVIYSRFHVFGVEAGGRYWKVQLHSFYGDVQGAPVSGLYSLQYSEVTADGPGPITEVLDLDATAGGSDAPDTAPSACLDLETKTKLMLTPPDAATNTDWDLCFRRAAVNVNGELGGPGITRAADLHLLETESEELEQVMARTKASEAARFEGVGYAELTDPKVTYRGDRIVSAFSDRWVVAGSSPPAPADIAWLVQGADGLSRYIALFDRFEEPTATTPGRVVMHIKKVE